MGGATAAILLRTGSGGKEIRAGEADFGLSVLSNSRGRRPRLHDNDYDYEYE